MKRTYRGLGSASAPVVVAVTAGQGKKGTQKDENREIFHIYLKMGMLVGAGTGVQVGTFLSPSSISTPWLM